MKRELKIAFHSLEIYPPHPLKIGNKPSLMFAFALSCMNECMMFACKYTVLTARIDSAAFVYYIEYYYITWTLFLITYKTMVYNPATRTGRVLRIIRLDVSRSFFLSSLSFFFVFLFFLFFQLFNNF